MKKQVKKELQKAGVKPGDRLLLALSSGIDSMVLWQVVMELQLPHAIAHVNFHLRGSESDEDQEFLENLAKQRKIKMYLRSAHPEELKSMHAGSTQMAARTLRYAWFEELMKVESYDWLCTAHHLNDSLETLLLNLERGTGIKGLLGIQSAGLKVRPLKNCSRAEIEVHAQEQKIPYREDSSNEDLKYKRNWLRHEIIKPWMAQKPDLMKNMAANFERVQSAYKAFQWAIDQDLQVLRKELNSGFMSLNALLELRFPESSLWELLHPLGLTESQVQEIQAAFKSKGVGLTWSSPTHRLILDREKLFVEEIQASDAKEEWTWIEETQTLIRQPISLELNLISPNVFQPNPDLNQAFFDPKKLKFPLKIRHWEPGDRIRLLGMMGQKKVSDLLIDKKIPLHKKEKVWVLCSEEEIVWVLGHGVSELSKVDSNTQEVLKMHWLL